jgi:hypothetical protein
MVVFIEKHGISIPYAEAKTMVLTDSEDEDEDNIRFLQ